MAVIQIASRLCKRGSLVVIVRVTQDKTKPSANGRRKQIDGKGLLGGRSVSSFISRRTTTAAVVNLIDGTRSGTDRYGSVGCLSRIRLHTDLHRILSLIYRLIVAVCGMAVEHGVGE
jgi:hypothetical protein